MRSVLLLGAAALALGAAGCREMDAPYNRQASVLASVRPLIHIERSNMGSKIEMDGDMGRELAFSRYASEGGSGDVLAAFTYLPLNTRSGDRDLRVYWLDALVSQRLALDNGPPVYFRYGLGWSLLFMDYDSEERDTFGLGAVTRLGVGYQFIKNAGVEVFGDLHGWMGYDGDQDQSAWAASVGLSVYVSF